MSFPQFHGPAGRHCQSHGRATKAPWRCGRRCRWYPETSRVVQRSRSNQKRSRYNHVRDIQRCIEMWWKFTSGCSDMPLCFSQWRIFLFNVIDCNLIPCASWYSCALATTEPSGCSNGSWAKSEVETRPVQQFSWKSCSQPQLESELSDSTDVVVQCTLQTKWLCIGQDLRGYQDGTGCSVPCFPSMFWVPQEIHVHWWKRHHMSIDRSMRTNTWPSAVLSRVRRTLLIVQQDRC